MYYTVPEKSMVTKKSNKSGKKVWYILGMSQKKKRPADPPTNPNPTHYLALHA